MPQNKTLNDWFIQYSQTANAYPKASQWYYQLLKNLYDYINEIKLGFYPVFVCNNIIATNKVFAVGLMRAKGLIIPSNASSDVMTIVHELGHNLGLRHTFDIPSGDSGDIKIKPINTFENIMDYLSSNSLPPVNHAKNFMTYQIDRMRENLARLKFNVDDMGYKIEDLSKIDPKHVIKDYKGSTNIQNFSKNLYYYLFQSYQGIYDLKDDTKLTSYEDKILNILVDVIKKYFNNL